MALNIKIFQSSLLPIFLKCNIKLVNVKKVCRNQSSENRVQYLDTDTFQKRYIRNKVSTLRKIILPTNWLRFFVYSTNLVCKMNNCIIPLTI